MKIRKDRLYAVVTGDVVASSKLEAGRRRELYAAMREASKSLLGAFGSAVPAEVDIYRGDSWQFLVDRPELALRTGLFYRAALRAGMERQRIDVRMALAVGTIEFVPRNRVSEGDGEAFRLAGEALESMPRGELMRFRFAGRREEEALDVLVRLVDPIARRWTGRQALAITGALRGWTQDRIATACWERPITQQAVAQHLDRAAWQGVEVALSFFEKSVREAASKQAKKPVKSQNKR